MDEMNIPEDLKQEYEVLVQHAPINWKRINEIERIATLEAALKELQARLSAYEKSVTQFGYDEIGEMVCEFGAPSCQKTEDGEQWYWCFSGSLLPVADTLQELLLAARQMLASRIAKEIK